DRPAHGGAPCRRGTAHGAAVEDAAPATPCKPRRSLVNTPALNADTRTPSTNEPECMRADELAKFLGVNRKTIYAYAIKGLIPHQRLGRRIVFSRSQVVMWLGQCKAASVRKGIQR